ncbi:MAG: SusC/RagA family TonB-linked outer membrane protein [Bacteroidales bacterium]|nr:SusC/RagA family TonB-linked outer membrane protein [Bacteroidales bacterium]
MKGSNKLGRFIATAIALFLSLGIAMAQSLSVNGKVVDAQGQPVVGASVIEKGTTNGTMTDLDGLFALKVKDGASLEVSSIGYATQVVKAAASVNVVLREDAEFLNEVVVVGFGTQKKANLTGSVASVNVGKALEARPISDVGRGLQGSAPGLNVVIGSMEVGSEPKLRIRGQVGSYEGSSAPLILVDNVEIPSLNLVNPEDIESISILKDAASASIYGAKAAFGVVLISTKKGAAVESTHVNYSGNVSFQNVDSRYGQGGVDAIHYRVLAAERSNMTDGMSGGFWLCNRDSWKASKAWVEKYKDLDPNSPMTYGRDFYIDGKDRKVGIRIYDPWNYMVREWAPTQQHNLSVSGRKGKSSFNASFGYVDQNGMNKVAIDKFNRYNANVRIDTPVNKWLAVHSGIMYSQTKTSYGKAVFTDGSRYGWSNLYRWGPTSPSVPVDEYGTELRNDAAQMSHANTGTVTNSYTSVNGGAVITPAKNWDINIDYTYSQNQYVDFTPGTVIYGADSWYDVPGIVYENGNMKTVANEWNKYNGLGESIPARAFAPSYYLGAGAKSSSNYIYRDNFETTRQTWNVNTTYALDVLADHHFNFMLGMQSLAYQYEGHWGKRTELMDITNPQFALATGTQTVGGSFDWNSTLGYYGRINYNYKEKYLFEANLRYDGTSKFPAALRWRWYPSFSAGWRVSEEPWMQPAKDVVSSLKVRASWGSIGDQSVASSLYIPTMSRGEASWVANDGTKLVYYSSPAAVSSALTWQDIETLDFGIDATLFDSFGITFDWFQRSTKNMIVGSEGVGVNFGAAAPKGNFGSLRTRGWEFAIDWGHIWDNGLSLKVNASLADAKTIVTEYGAATSIDGWYNGKTYGEIWGYKTNGLFTNDDFARDNDGNLIMIGSKDPTSVDIDGNPYPYDHYQFAPGKNYPLQDRISGGGTYTKFGPGDVRYCDLDGNGVVNDGTRSIKDHGDLTVIGNTTPRYEYSFRLDAAWKGFDFSMFWQGIGKRNMWSDQKAAIPMSGSDGYMPLAMAKDFWYEDWEDGQLVDHNYDAFYARPSYSGMNYAVSDRYLLNLAYLRLKNLTVGYTLPRTLSQQISMDRCRVYVTLENFLTFNKLHGLPIDVEGAISGSPAFKTAAVGLQVTF